jgi:hypothetical protein
MYLNQLTIIGFTGQDADFHFTSNGTPVTTLSVATKESWKDSAALLFFFLFLDNLLRHVEGQGWGGFWPCSGRLEVMLLYVVLSLLAHFVYWSRIVSGVNQEHT